MNLQTIERIVRKAVQPIYRRARLMVLRAVTNLVNDAGGLQIVQVDSLDGMTVDDVEHFQPFGLSGYPPKDSEGMLLAVGGNVDHPVLLCASHRDHRPTGLAEGEVKVYNQNGQYVHIQAGGSIDLVSGSGIVNLAEASPTGWIARADLVDARLDTIEVWAASIVSAHNEHVHDDAEGRPTDKVGMSETPPHHFTVLPTLGTVACTKVKGT